MDIFLLFLLYMFTRVNTLANILEIFSVLTGLTFFGLLFSWVVCDQKDLKSINITPTFLKSIAVCWVALLLLVVLVPRQKDIAIIAAGYFTFQAATSEPAKKIYTIINDKLDQEIEAIVKGKKKD